MCGIFGYVGSSSAAAQIVEGLKRLEYRGYDSWGVAVLNKKISVYKTVGAIGDLKTPINLPKSFIGIGHTRWATHGKVSKLNAHPHYSDDKKFVLAQNGIVENYQKLKNDLFKKGAQFKTETDTEVIVRLIEYYLKKDKNLIKAIRQAFLKLKGRNTFIVLTSQSEVIAVRCGSPLVVGISEKTGDVYLSSDTLSFSQKVNKIIVLENGQMVRCCKAKVELFDVKSGQKVKHILEDIGVISNKINKEGFPHFMLKEIYESTLAIKQLINQKMDLYHQLSKEIRKADTVYIIASGTAGIAASQMAFYLRSYSKIKAVPLIGADAIEYLNLFTSKDLIISPSQSGETADVLEVLEIAKKKGVKIASFVNMQGSSMTRLSDFKFMAQAGPEICVMSTKVFISQLAFGYLLSKVVLKKEKEGLNNLKILSQKINTYLLDDKNHQKIKKVSKYLIQARDIFMLGKYQNFNIVKEGMVKLIEGTYKHAHAIPAGDLKHYAITLIEKGIPVIVAVSEDKARDDVINAVNQVKARGATVVAISAKNHESFDYLLQVPDTEETSAIMNTIPLQLLAYYMAVELGHNVDKPRNIAKSVTVK